MIVLVASISQYDPDASRLDVISVTKVVLTVVTAVLAVIHLLLIPQRLLEREICAIAFMICHALAHIIAPVIIVTSGDPTQFIFCWAVLCFFGDLVKFAFLKVEDEFEVHMLTRQRLFALTGVTCFLYFAVMVLVVIVWTVDYVVV